MKHDGELVGGFLYDNFNGASIMAHVAGEGKWMNKELLWMAFDYPFNKLGVNTVILSIPANNTKANRFAKRLGFSIQATLKEAAPDGDLLIYSMLRNECTFLRG